MQITIRYQTWKYPELVNVFQESNCVFLEYITVTHILCVSALDILVYQAQIPGLDMSPNLYQLFFMWTREKKFTLHSEMKPGECSNANTRTCNGITNFPASNFKRAGRWLVMIVK